MTDHATSNSCPDRAKITPEGRLALNRLNVCAKKAIEPCAKTDRTLSNAIAAIHLENSKIMGPVIVHPNKQAPHRNGFVLGPSLAAAPARQIAARCVDQKSPIQSTPPSLLSSSQSSNSQTNVFVSSDNATGYTNHVVLPESSAPSSVIQQPSSRPSLPNFPQASSTRTIVPPSDATGLINFLLLPTSVAPSPPVVQQKPPPIHKIFPNNIAKPVLRSSLPDLAFHFKSTRQLAFGLLLLAQDTTSSSSSIATQGKAQGLVLTKDEMVWVTKMRVATEEHDHLRWLAAQVVTQFLKKQHKDAGSIEEVMLLGAVLERKDYRGVLSALIGQLECEKLTDVDLLQALVQFLQLAPSKHLVDDDFVRILRVLRGRLKDTHKALNDKKQSGSDHVHHLSTAIARVLDAMIEGKIHGLDRAEDHLPLLDLLAELKESVDPYLKFQAKHAWQALQYVGDDETPLQAVLRFGGGVTKAALGVASVFKLDPEHLFDGLYELGLAAGQVYDVVKAGVEGAQAFRAGGEGVVDSMLKGFRSGAKKAWYPALQGARVFIREGRLADFERVIYEAPCCREPEFQMGVCQLLGELAVDPIWELKTRQQAVNLLRQLYTSDATWVVDTGVKVGVLGILLRLSMTEDNTIRLQSAVIFEDLAHDRVGAPPGPYPLALRLPIPTASPLMDKTLKIQSIERNLLRMKTLRLAQHDQAIYIPPLAKANPQTPEEEATPLLDQVMEFLDSERQVFLVIGDSGSGKSTFNLHLEYTLWKAYEQGDPRIPLYIHLPTLQSLTSLIGEQLMKYHFDMSAIQELKLTGREFIVICDGYDEARLTTNLHSSNGWNRPFGWNTKMIVSCRSTHLGREYHTRFQPTPSSPYHAPLLHLFQEAVIVPFSQDQIKEYVEQFVQDPTVHGLFCRKEVEWSTEKYLDMIERIPNLAELVRNPFLLTLALRALPDVVMNGREGGADSTTTDETATAGVAEMTRSQLYKSFVSQWLEINKRRLITSLTFQCPTVADTLAATTPTAASTLQDLIDEGFQEIALDFLQSLAAAIYKYQRGKPTVEYWHRSDKTTWKADFFGPELDITLLRESSPLTKVENFHFFIHRSLMEYFYSCHLARTTRPRYGFKKPGPEVALPTMFAHDNFSSNATLNSYYDISEDNSRYWPSRHHATQLGEDALLEYNPSPFQHQSQSHLPHRQPQPQDYPSYPQGSFDVVPQASVVVVQNPPVSTTQPNYPNYQSHIHDFPNSQSGHDVEPPLMHISPQAACADESRFTVFYPTTCLPPSQPQNEPQHPPYSFQCLPPPQLQNEPQHPPYSFQCLPPPQLQNEQQHPPYSSQSPPPSPPQNEQLYSSYSLESLWQAQWPNMHQYPAYPFEPPFQPPPIQYEQQYEQHYPFYAMPNSHQPYPNVIGGSKLEKLQHTKSKSELESEAGPCFDDGLMESVDLEEEEPEILQFLVERAREDEKYRSRLREYVGVDVKKFTTPEALRNAKRILELVDV